MWQESDNVATTKGDAGGEKKYTEDPRAGGGRQDSGIVDSGFLSSEAIFQTSSEFGVEEREGAAERLDAGSSPSAKVGDPARTDSGLDLCLSESLGRLSLRRIGPDGSDRGKVQSEPTVELTPVKTRRLSGGDCEPSEGAYDPARYAREPWELYYAQDDDGDTQLHIAIVQGFLEAAFSLVRMAPHPCLLNILNDDCQAPLHLAILTRQSRIARRLILAGADPTIRDFRGNTPLHLACFSGDLACARALTDPLSPVERNYLANSPRIPALPQNLEQRNYDGEMCLHVAAAGGQVDIVRHLLRLGADLEAREGLSGRTALHLALERGSRSVVTFLLQECRPCLDAPTYAGITAYQIAICLDSQLARELVRLGAKPEPLPETDSEFSEDSGDEDTPYMPAITRLRQGVGVRA